MIADRPVRTRASLRILAGGGAAVALVLAACAADDLVADHRVSDERVAALATATSRGGFVVQNNELVAQALNRRVGTPDGRLLAQQALDRASGHRAMILRHLDAHGLPHALLAVPVVESGYQNLPAPDDLKGGKVVDCAGLWQFIPATARAYGLRVDRSTGVDERLDLEKETDAAARLLADLFAEFGDWALALSAYNQGSKHVRSAIEQHQTRDAWELTRRGALNGYAVQVMAAAMIMADPSLIGELN